MTDTDLIEAARAAARNAYAPYSRFGVGAALRLEDGSIVSGCNFENASYGLTLCAETVALASANAQGVLAQVVGVAVIGGPMAEDGSLSGTAPVFPCGRCRQMLYEAACISQRDLPVDCAAAQGHAVKRYRISELLPDAFGPSDLPGPAEVGEA